MMTKLRSIGSAVILTVLMACSTQSDMVEEIVKLERSLYSNPQSVFDPQIAEKLVNQYVLFIETYPEDTLAGSYLFKGAEVSMGMTASAKAIELYERVYNEYPDFPRAATALFLIAFVNETQVKNLSEAQKYYRKFIAEFPDHNLVDDATFSLKNLGKSDEEIIKEFEAKLAKGTQQDSL